MDALEDPLSERREPLGLWWLRPVAEAERAAGEEGGSTRDAGITVAADVSQERAPREGSHSTWGAVLLRLRPSVRNSVMPST